MGKFYCAHCKTLLESEGEWYAHQAEVLGEQERRRKRGGVFVTIDGDEYWAPSVTEIKANNIRVLLKYYRYYGRRGLRPAAYIDPFWGRDAPSPKGGACHVILLAPDGNWSEGWSRCSRKDVFSKKKGYVLAVNAALSDLPGDLYTFDKSFIEALRQATSE